MTSLSVFLFVKGNILSLCERNSTLHSIVTL